MPIVKLQASVYDILPLTTARIGYATGLPMRHDHFIGLQNGSKRVTAQATVIISGSISRINFYWCSLLMRVVSLIIVRSVQYHFCEKSWNKKGRRKRRMLTMLIPAQIKWSVFLLMVDTTIVLHFNTVLLQVLVALRVLETFMESADSIRGFRDNFWWTEVQR